MSELLTVEQAAKRLNVSEKWIRRAIFDKKLPIVRLGRLVRIEPAQLEQFIVRSRVHHKRAS